MRGNISTMFRITQSVNPGLLLLGVICVALLAAAPAGAVDVTVLDGKTGLAIPGGYRWTLEEDTTYHVQLDANGEVALESNGTPVLDPKWAQGHTLALSFHTSYFPVVEQGSGPTTSAALDSEKRYYISVMPDSGYSVGGAQIAPGQTNVTVYVNPLPIPTAQISVFVFEDNYPTNSAPDTATIALPGGAADVVEDGIPGFQIILEDAGGRYGASAGQAIMDAFGNPLGTTYFRDGDNNPILDADGAPQVVERGTGVIFTDADGWAFIENLAPAKYGIIVVPPTGLGWQQTTTIEGTIVIDAWVKANEPRFFAEFGPPGPHVFMGFVQVDPDTMEFIDDTTLGAGISVTGQVANLHLSRPPDTAFYQGAVIEHTTPWVALNDLGQGPDGKAVYIGETDGGAFTIDGVPEGIYQISVFDNNLDFVIGLQNLTVNADGSCFGDPANPISPCDLGFLQVRQWFTRLEHDVFTDLNEDGFWDPNGVDGIPDTDDDETPLLEQNVNLRWRNGDINQAMATDGEGFVPFDEVFPFFSWQVAEVDYARGKPTGVTVTVDAGGEIPTTGISADWSMGGQLNPQLQPDNGDLPFRTETGPVLTQAYQGFLGQTSVMTWGKVPWKFGENGGISGMVIYGVTRAEDDPRWAAVEPWEPGIPRITVELYADADLDGVADGPAILSTMTDSWDDSLPTGCVNPLPADDPFFAANPGVDCFDGLRSFNQVRPGVFDGGYAFGPEIECSNQVCLDSTHMVDGVRYLNRGGYVVAIDVPVAYTLTKEEDRNVDFGDEYVPSSLLTPAVCVGESRLVPDDLVLFPGVEVGSDFGSTWRPLCDKKQVLLSGGANAAADFILHTEAPIAGHIIGFILDDLANEFDPTSVQFGEKYAPPFLPVAIHDWTGREISRVYSDEYGRYNLPVPSTYTANLPMPSGMSPNMLTACMNSMMAPDPDNLGEYVKDALFNPQYSQFCYTFQYMPGVTTYLDTPVVPVAAFAGPGQFPVDCDPQDGIPGIASVTNGTSGPWVPTGGGSIVITSLGSVPVPNPDYCPQSDQVCDDLGFAGNPKTIQRDYSFGAGADATLDGTALGCTYVDASDTLTCNVGVADGRYQLMVANGAGESEVGVTVTVGGDAPTTVCDIGCNFTTIQAAIDAAVIPNNNNPNIDNPMITVASGTYNEMVIMYKPVRLQGWGAGSVNINAINIPFEKIQSWRDKIGQIVADNDADLLPGQEIGNLPGIGANVLGTEQAPGIFVMGKAQGNQRFDRRHARIDGMYVSGSTTGGGILVNGYAGTSKNAAKKDGGLQISNNRVENSTGFLNGGIRIGHPNLVNEQGNTLEYTDSENSNITIAYNQVFRNGALDGAGGGISLYHGSNRYRVADNNVCGNFTRGHGGGIGHLGLSEDGVIENNTIKFNETFNQGPIINVHGGGIYIGGAPGIIVGDLTEGAGHVSVTGNLIRGNMAGAGDGGGIALDAVNGEDAKNINKAWKIDLVNNTIANNVAGGVGGGISLQDSVAVRIAHNTVTRNDSTATTGGLADTGTSTRQIAGIAALQNSQELINEYERTAGEFSDPEIVDSFVYQNRSFHVETPLGGNPGLYPEEELSGVWDWNDLGVVDATAGQELSPTFCVLTDAAGYDTSNISGGSAVADAANWFVEPAINTKRLTNMMQEQSLQITFAPDEGGNSMRIVFGIAADPGTDWGRLSSAIGDFHLATGSPAIDAATDLDPAVTDDIDRGARPNGTANDIGSDEFGASAADAKAGSRSSSSRTAGRRVGGGR